MLNHLRVLPVVPALLVLALLGGCGGDRGAAPLDAGDLEGARTLLEEARERLRDPSWQPAPIRAILMVEVGLPDEAAALESSIEDVANRALVRAVRMFRSHRYLEVDEALRVVLAERPDDEAALLLRAELELVANREAEARRTGERLIELDRRNPDAAVLLGRIHLGAGDPDLARDWVREALRSNAGHAEAHLLEAEALLVLGRGDEAAAALGRALRFDPLHPDGRFLKGLLLESDPHRAAESAAHFDLALEVHPFHLPTHLHRAGGSGTLEDPAVTEGADALPHGEIVELIAMRRDAFQAAVARGEALKPR